MKHYFQPTVQPTNCRAYSVASVVCLQIAVRQCGRLSQRQLGFLFYQLAVSSEKRISRREFNIGNLSILQALSVTYKCFRPLYILNSAGLSSGTILAAPCGGDLKKPGDYGERGSASLYKRGSGAYPSGSQRQSPWLGGQGRSSLKLQAFRLLDV